MVSERDSVRVCVSDADTDIDFRSGDMVRVTDRSRVWESVTVSVRESEKVTVRDLRSTELVNVIV